MGKRVDIPVKDIEEEFKNVREFIETEYPGRESYGKRFIGKKAFSIASKQVDDWKHETKDIKDDWHSLKKEIEDTI
ncbi:MAG: hypothetical protein H8Z69_03910 [Nanohaloarchaea archaeon]|nr:hypothetical protein [Candidatus Nanohaloarchaea archaeon]